jgi:acyl-CoA synthetase (AMP-forming)/AMP-acid ligase II
MLDLDRYGCLGAALRDALQKWPNELCLIESDRDKEKTRLTYSDFKDIATPVARAIEDAEFKPGDRGAIIMSNQSKWLISAYAIFYCGGVLVPLDYKLSADEHLQLLAHSKSSLLVVEFHLWRAITKSPEFKNKKFKTVLVTEAPPDTDLAGAIPPKGRTAIRTTAARGSSLHRVFVGDRRTAQRVRADPCELFGTVQISDGAVPFQARHTVLEHSSYQPRHRFHGWLHRPICLRGLRGASANFAAGICARRVRSISHQLCQPGSTRG